MLAGALAFDAPAQNAVADRDANTLAKVVTTAKKGTSRRAAVFPYISVAKSSVSLREHVTERTVAARPAEAFPQNFHLHLPVRAYC
jgi:hypothetical protein